MKVELLEMQLFFPLSAVNQVRQMQIADSIKSKPIWNQLLAINRCLFHPYHRQSVVHSNEEDASLVKRVSVVNIKAIIILVVSP